MSDAEANQLFTGPVSVTMGDRGGPVRPGQALLFSTDSGDLVEVPRRPSAFGALKFRLRYEVNLSDHTVSWSEPLPSGTGGFAFQASFEARWRVTDPVQVVRRGIESVAKGHAEVCVAMRDLLWPHAVQHGIERLADFAHFVRTSICGRPHQLSLGVTVDSLVVRVYLDAQADDHLRALKQAEFDTAQVRAQHIVTATTQDLNAQLQVKREEALLAAARGEGGLFLHLIGQDPSKLHEIMLELGNRHDIAVDQKATMLKDLISAGLIQPAEAQIMWQDMHRPAPLFGGGGGELAGPAVQAPAQLQSGAADGRVPQSPQQVSPQHAPGQPSQQPPSVVAGIVVNPAEGAAPPRPRRREAGRHDHQHDHRQGRQEDHEQAPAPAPAPAPVPQQTPPQPQSPPQAQAQAQAQAQPQPDPGTQQGSANVTGATRVGRRRDSGPDGSSG
ncbi:hypothetical protein OG883_20255 [Streptomyces sp. NBC_01142]|uniref:hypothetical protein n=1 Tax=Streptomyces sp. NBC_01142 TaxID=2975865 RepID=UPI0022556EA8|nr:hypothetical protein [Streptomyces sp. NBC_01142]MCX4822176.1 hypothetical protein [Streptomyces sp. NBC_01142]